MCVQAEEEYEEAAAAASAVSSGLDSVVGTLIVEVSTVDLGVDIEGMSVEMPVIEAPPPLDAEANTTVAPVPAPPALTFGTGGLQFPEAVVQGTEGQEVLLTLQRVNGSFGTTEACSRHGSEVIAMH